MWRNTEEKFTLIDTVRAFPELWDDKHPQFKDGIKRSQAWAVVKRDLEKCLGKDFSDDVLKRTFKNLKDTYRRKLKEIKDHNMRSTGSDVSDNVEKIKSWMFFDALTFLDPIMDQGNRVAVKVEDNENLIDLDEIQSPATSQSSSRSRTPQAGSSFDAAENWTKDRSNRLGRKLEGLAAAINSPKDSNARMDRADINGMRLAGTLHEMKESKPAIYPEWIIRTEEFMLQMTRALYEP
ncbi:hypothetical protein Q1695_013915 [Nippostrongylus brasiliensis]|nr:hypothetical protein Q1695_013915 [Nippostrongylus brasiliensis]